jgi:hypothetical protein
LILSQEKILFLPEVVEYFHVFPVTCNSLFQANRENTRKANFAGWLGTLWIFIFDMRYWNAIICIGKSIYEALK